MLRNFIFLSLVLAGTPSLLAQQRVDFEGNKVFATSYLLEWHCSERIVNPLEKRLDSLGGGVLLGPNGLPVPGLKSYTLAVCSVTFTDGSTWNRSPLCR